MDGGVPARPASQGSSDGAADRAAPPSIEVVVFDMDGLLLNTELLAREALQRAGREVGIALLQSDCALMIGVAADACRRLVLDHCGTGAPVDALFEASTRHLHAQIEEGLLRVKPGAHELLALLDERRMPRAVATSSARAKALHHLEAAGLLDRFDAIVTRDEVERGKPHPDLYLRAAERLNVPPARCLALEDSYNGVRAARAAGIPVVMVPDLLPPTDEMRQLAMAVVEDLHAVVSTLRVR